MRATKLVSVSVALWAVLMGAGRASAGAVNVSVPVPRVNVHVPSNVPRVNVPTKVSVPTGSVPRVNAKGLITGPNNLGSIRSEKMKSYAKGLITPKEKAPEGRSPQQPNNTMEPSSTGGAGPQQGAASKGGGGSGGVATSSQPATGGASPQLQAEGASFSGSGAAGGGSSGGSDAAGGGSSSGSGRGPARYYAPASHNSKTACGRYPYAPCK